MRAARASALIPILVACGLPARAGGPQGSGAFQGFRWEGGSGEDRAFAEAASGLVRGKPVDAAGGFALALEAIRATDRFQRVEGALEDGPSGPFARIRLEPVVPLRTWEWDGGPLDKKTRRMLLPDLRGGVRLGRIKTEQWRRQAEARLRDEGYPAARLALLLEEGGARLRIRADLGPANRIQKVETEGESGSYRLSELEKLAGIQPGRTLWTQALRRSATRALRRRFVKDRRLEGHADLSYASDGTLRIRLDPGPVVRLRSTGESLGQRALRELVPLTRSDRYDPELLDEGDRRIVRHFRDKGYLDVDASHVREVQGDGTVLVTYRIRLGERRTVQRLAFEGNQELDDRELRRVADLPSGFLGIRPPRATPDLLDEAETRIKNRYLSLGYSDVRLRRRMETRDGQQTLVLNVREGPRRTVQAIILEFPEGDAWDPWKLGENLLRAVADQPVLVPPALMQRRRYRSGRDGKQGVTAVLELLPRPSGKPGRAVRLLTERPVPYVRAELAAVLSALNQSVAALGTSRPIIRTRFEEDEAGATIHIEIPPQSLQRVRRLAVQGSDETRARAVLRETRELEPGNPLNLDRIGRAQANLGDLGAFKRVDVVGVREADPAAAKEPWTDGDLALRLEERSHWVFSESFGYDRGTGYSFGYGVQRLNFQGMGRTLDFGMRAGDGTIDNPTLRRMFPTGDFARSVDSYKLGYTDPWFSPGVLTSLLPDRALYRAEAAYIQEQQTAYLIRRRRLLNTLEWRLDANRVLRVGHRFERADVRANKLSRLPGDPPLTLDEQYLEENYLNIATRSPARSTISAPFIEWIRDTRDSPYDPTSGTVSAARLELANQLFGTSKNSSFVKLDLRQQWTWSLGYRASAGVASVGIHLGVARPTDSTSRQLPLSERFFAGGAGSQRGVEPDYLGPLGSVPLLVRQSDGTYVQARDAAGNKLYEVIPIGGQGIAILNLDYRFPIYKDSIWGELFVDAGQVYENVVEPPGSTNPLDPPQPPRQFPPLRISAGAGVIFKVGLPIKIEYGADAKRILGRPRSPLERLTQLHSLLISAGFQF